MPSRPHIPPRPDTNTTESNLSRTIAHSPAAAGALTALHAGAESMLTPRLRLAIALRVSELNECDYCRAAHVHEAAGAGVKDEDIVQLRQGRSTDDREQALLAVASKLVRNRGHHAAVVLDAARAVGATDRDLVEVVALVALNVFYNYLAALGDVEIDAPPASDLDVAGRRLR